MAAASLPRIGVLVIVLCLSLHATAAEQDSSAPPLPADTGAVVPFLLQPESTIVELPVHQERVLKLDLTRDPNDIWDRLRRGFAMPDLDSNLVVEMQGFYLNRPGFLRRVFERGGQYLYHIVDEIERRGMPTEIALLPMVESNFNPMAYSRAHASGMWQFIPSTGRNFNLVQNSWVDERRDVIASTNAALDYLEYLYNMHGDWHLALASYNWGEGAVGRAMRRNRDEGLPAEYSHLRMPDETRRYIPKLQALKNIVASPELFAFELPFVPNDRMFTTVEAPQGIDLATAAELAEMPIEDFIALNPAYNRPVLGLSGQSLVVPLDRVTPFRERLGDLENEAGRWKTYELRRGEDLGAVARRFGLSVTQLRQINRLSANSRITPGMTLLVPDGIDPSGAIEAARALGSGRR